MGITHHAIFIFLGTMPDWIDKLIMCAKGSAISLIVSLTIATGTLS